MCAIASSTEMRLCSLPMRAPPVRSYIHMAEPRARLSFGFSTPSLPVNIGMRNGRTLTRWGAFLVSRWRSCSAS